MGLGFEAANTQNVSTVITELKSKGLISRQLIGVNVERASDNNPDGEISFGIIDTSKFTGSLITVPNVNFEGLWEVPLVIFYIGAKVTIGRRICQWSKFGFCW